MSAIAWQLQFVDLLPKLSLGERFHKWLLWFKDFDFNRQAIIVPLPDREARFMGGNDFSSTGQNRFDLSDPTVEHARKARCLFPNRSSLPSGKNPRTEPAKQKKRDVFHGA